MGSSGERISWLHVMFVVTGFVIGAGILGLPIKFGSSGMGFIPGAILIIVGGVFQVLTAIFIVKIMILFKPRELTGYTLDFLGRVWWFILYLSVFLYVIGALEAYLDYGGKAFYVLSHGLIRYELGVLIYWFAGLIIVLYGARALGNAEGILVTGFFTLLAVISLLCFTSRGFSISNLEWMNPSRIMAGFGVTIFAYAAHFAIPSIGKHYSGSSRRLAIAVSLGFLAPMIGYIIWTAAFMGLIPESFYQSVSGLPAPIAVAVLGNAPKSIVVLGYTFGFLTTFTSFIAALYSLASITREFITDVSGVRIGFSKTAIPIAILALTLALVVPVGFIGWLDIAGSLGAPLFSGIIPSLLILKVGVKAGKPPLKIPCWKILACASILFYLAGMMYYIKSIV